MKTAILVSVPVENGLRAQIKAGVSPQRDYLALADALNATLIAPVKALPRNESSLAKLRRIFTCAWAAFQMRHQYDIIVTDLDRVGLLLAFLFKAAGVRRRQLVVCHGRLATGLDRNLAKLLGLRGCFDRVVCYGPLVARRVVELVGIPPERVVMVRHPADHHFWHPLPVEPQRLIVSAGLYRRDYPTLMEAVRDLEVEVVVAGHSPWITRNRRDPPPVPIPPNVRFARYSYYDLRELYARSLFVAVPLVNGTVTQAGALVIYEAMAMGKAVVATRTAGQEMLGIVREGETGMLVEPGDVQGWRRAVTYLLGHPEEAARMGRRARSLVEEGLSMEGYVREMVSVVESVAAEARAAQGAPSRP